MMLSLNPVVSILTVEAKFVSTENYKNRFLPICWVSLNSGQNLDLWKQEQVCCMLERWTPVRLVPVEEITRKPPNWEGHSNWLGQVTALAKIARMQTVLGVIEFLTQQWSIIQTAIVQDCVNIGDTSLLWWCNRLLVRFSLAPSIQTETIVLNPVNIKACNRWLYTEACKPYAYKCEHTSY